MGREEAAKISIDLEFRLFRFLVRPTTKYNAIFMLAVRVVK